MRPNGTEWWVKAFFYLLAACIAILAATAASRGNAAQYPISNYDTTGGLNAGGTGAPCNDVRFGELDQAFTGTTDLYIGLVVPSGFSNINNFAVTWYSDPAYSNNIGSAYFGSGDAIYTISSTSTTAFNVYFRLVAPTIPAGSFIGMQGFDGTGHCPSMGLSFSGDISHIFASTATDALDGPVIPASALNFLVPQNGTSTPASFGQWELTFDNFSTSTSATVKVFFGVSSSTLYYGDSTYLPSLAPATYDVQIPRTSSLVPGTFYARAVAYNATSTTEIAASDIISFTTEISLPPSATSTTPGAGGVFSNLFVRLSRKPPFGYFLAIRAGLEGLATSTPAFELMTTSTVAAAAGVFTPIRTGFIWIIWFYAGLWVYHRLRMMTF